MNILGVSGAVGHDASAALFVDGELVAAVEEDILQTDHPSPYMTFTFDVVLRLPVFHGLIRVSFTNPGDPVIEPLYPLCRLVADGLAYPHRRSH